MISHVVCDGLWNGDFACSCVNLVAGLIRGEVCAVDCFDELVRADLDPCRTSQCCWGHQHRDGSLGELPSLCGGALKDRISDRIVLSSLGRVLTCSEDFLPVQKNTFLASAEERVYCQCRRTRFLPVQKNTFLASVLGSFSQLVLS